ncbi:MAG: hypothetical protein Q4P08_00745 [Eubacteriales bacterium]|nr:hypothetical protein [Eubacteriales bacterium]
MKKETSKMLNRANHSQGKKSLGLKEVERGLIAFILACLILFLPGLELSAMPSYEEPSSRSKPFLIKDDKIPVLEHGDSNLYNLEVYISHNRELVNGQPTGDVILPYSEIKSASWVLSSDPAVFPLVKSSSAGKGSTLSNTDEVSASAAYVVFSGYKVHPAAAPGRYYLPIEIQYDNGVGTIKSQIAYLTVDIGGEPSGESGGSSGGTAGSEQKEEKPQLADPVDRKSILMVKEGAVPRLELGQELELVLPIVNRGDQFVRIVNVTPQIGLDDNYPFEITQSDYTRQVETLLAPQGVLGGGYNACGIGTDVSFGKVWVKSDLKRGYYKVDFVVRFQDFITRKEVLYPCPDNPSLPCTKEGYRVDLPADYSELTLSLIFYVNGLGDDSQGDDGKIPTPRLISTGFRTTPEKVTGGEEFTLRLMLHNASNVTNIQNVRLSFDSGDGTPFLPTDGASTKFIDSIAAGGDYEIILNFKASATLEEKIYPLNIAMEYEDYKSTSYQAAETLSIPIFQETRVSIAGVEAYPGVLSVGEEGNLTFNLLNKGKTMLNNASIVLPEDGPISAPELFLGNVEPGSTKAVDLMVMAVSESIPGEKIKILIKYEDGNSKEQIVEDEIDLQIMPAEEHEDFGDFPGDMPPGFEDEFMDQENAGKKLPIWAWILIALILLIVLIVIISTLLKRKKRQRQAKEDAEFFRQLEADRKQHKNQRS